MLLALNWSAKEKKWKRKHQQEQKKKRRWNQAKQPTCDEAVVSVFSRAPLNCALLLLSSVSLFRRLTHIHYSNILKFIMPPLRWSSFIPFIRRFNDYKWTMESGTEFLICYQLSKPVSKQACGQGFVIFAVLLRKSHYDMAGGCTKIWLYLLRAVTVCAKPERFQYQAGFWLNCKTGNQIVLALKTKAHHRINSNMKLSELLP